MCPLILGNALPFFGGVGGGRRAGVAVFGWADWGSPVPQTIHGLSLTQSCSFSRGLLNFSFSRHCKVVYFSCHFRSFSGRLTPALAMPILLENLFPSNVFSPLQLFFYSSHACAPFYQTHNGAPFPLRPSTFALMCGRVILPNPISTLLFRRRDQSPPYSLPSAPVDHLA